MILKITNAFLAAAALTGLSSCIQETMPADYVLNKQLEGSETAVDAMVNSIYTMMTGYENEDLGIEKIGYDGMRVMLEHGTTGMLCPGGNGWNTMGAYCYGAVSANGSNRGLYPSTLYYGYIKTVNDIIKMIDPEDMNDHMKHYLGMSYVFRALFYHDIVQIMEYKKPTDTRYSYVEPENDLTNLGVPIVTEETSAEQAAHNPRATVDEVYDLILSDLKKAETYLADFSRTDVKEPDLACVYGMYARVYQSLGSRVATSATYKDEAAYWQNAAKYADMAIQTSGCTPLTEDEWTDPVNGFNNRLSQNSWLWATTISEESTYWSSFHFASIMATETRFSAYGYRVGRGLDRRMYERLADTDFRKKSWLAPNFFYESKNQVEGAPYLIEKDADGNFINNKWDEPGRENEYSGFGPDKYQYKFNNNAANTREACSLAHEFRAWPWIYVNLKFRPHNGNYSDNNTGSATDFPVMRVEELYFIKAEATSHTASPALASAELVNLIKTRNPNYNFTASSYEDFIDEMAYQKAIEFWGEGLPYFDAKRLELGIHRAYKGNSHSSYSHALDMNGVFVGWTPGWNEAERNANPDVFHYNNPYTAPSVYYVYRSLPEISNYYGCDIEANN